MHLITKHIKWIMLVSGALTCTMFFLAIAPQAALMSSFGESLDGPLADIIVRSWGILIALVGAMLIYGAFNPLYRTFVITIATVSKIAFIILLLALGQQYIDKTIVTILFDGSVSVLFVIYLLSTKLSK